MKQVLGSDHPSLAVMLSRTGQIRGAMGDWTGMFEDHVAAFELRLRTLGADHPEDRAQSQQSRSRLPGKREPRTGARRASRGAEDPAGKHSPPTIAASRNRCSISPEP